MSNIIGKCGNCGGDVILHIAISPKPYCVECGSNSKENGLPVLDMEPAPKNQIGDVFPVGETILTGETFLIGETIIVGDTHIIYKQAREKLLKDAEKKGIVISEDEINEIIKEWNN